MQQMKQRIGDLVLYGTIPCSFQAYKMYGLLVCLSFSFYVGFTL